MIARLKNVAKRHWPSLRLRTILLATLLLTAALPGFGALFLRVYENTLVRQTEAELIAQGAVLVAAAQTLAYDRSMPAVDYRPEASTIDLRTTAILNERPTAPPANRPPTVVATDTAGRLGPIARVTQRTTLASIQLIDANGTVVLGHEAGGSYAALPEVRAALGGQVRTVLRQNGRYAQRYSFEWLSRASSLRIHHARPIIVDGRVVGVLLLARSPRALFRGLYEDRGKILLGIALILGVLIVLAGLLSRGIAKPIETLGRATRALAVGQASIPETPATAAIEIRELFENYRAMTTAIERRSRYLHDFAAAVSHEFKTPLAGIRGAVELLDDHGATMTTEERERFLGNIADDAARLSQLVGRLLDLARADMTRAQLDAATEATVTINAIADAFWRPGQKVTVASPVALPLIAVPAATLQAVLTTLLENALQAGAASVRIEASESEGGVAITVTDDGPGIAPRDRERLFEPFFTTRREAGGTGLGLAIARSLLAASGGQLELVETEAGAAFRLWVPAAR